MPSIIYFIPVDFLYPNWINISKFNDFTGSRTKRGHLKFTHYRKNWYFNFTFKVFSWRTTFSVQVVFPSHTGMYNSLFRELQLFYNKYHWLLKSSRYNAYNVSNIFFKNLMLEKCTCISPINMIVDPINCKSICSNHTCFCYHSQIWVTRIYWGSKKRDVKFLQKKSSGNQLLVMFRWKFEVKTFSNKHQTV